jgi:hypothetical protein
LIERFDLDRGAMVAARPDGAGRCGIVGEDAAHVGIARRPKVQNLSKLLCTRHHLI